MRKNAAERFNREVETYRKSKKRRAAFIFGLKRDFRSYATEPSVSRQAA